MPSRRQPMSARELVDLYEITQTQYYDDEPVNSYDELRARVNEHLPDSMTHVSHADDVVKMYIEAKTQPQFQSQSQHTSSAFTPAGRTSVRKARDSGRSCGGLNLPNITYVDLSNKTHITNKYVNTTPTPDRNNNKKDKKEKSTQEQTESYLMMGAVIILLSILGLIASFAFGNLFSELGNHISRLWYNDGVVQASCLLMGVGISYCLAMFSIYEVAGGLLMGAMITAGFANPAAWACAAVVLGALIATPVFNMFIREGIYSVFSYFDNDALVSTDNRFRVLTQQEIDSLPNNIDPNRVNFATLFKHDELKVTQKRQRFAFFDMNSHEMSEALDDVRAMRHIKSDGNASINFKADDSNEKISFSLLRNTRANVNTAPSAPPASAQDYQQFYNNS